MRKSISKQNAILLKSDSWTPSRRRKSKFDQAQDAIFNLRYIKEFSFTAIKKFLAEAGVRASTGALSAFCHSRFDPETVARMKSEVATQLASLKNGR